MINIHPNAPPGDQSNLLHHLCNESEQIESDTVLILAPGLYEIQNGHSCIISDISNLTIRGADANGTENYSELICLFNLLGSNFIFLNVSNLVLEDLVISNCGRYIPDDLPSYVNDSYVYFDLNQKAVLLFAQVTNLHFENCVLASSFGYAVIGVNLQGENILNRIRIVGSDSMKHPLCFGYETSLSCSGSGAVFIYSDPGANNTFQVTDTSLVISNSTFDYNKNYVPLAHFLMFYTLARSPHNTERLVLFGGNGVSLFTSQRSYFTDILIQDSTFNNNIAESSSLVILPVNSIRNFFISVNNCTFHDNVVRAPGRGGAVSLIVLVFIDSLQTFPEYPDDVFTILKITDSEFMDNEGSIGGAVFIHYSPVNVTNYGIVFDTVAFIRNIAATGSAVVANSIPTLFLQKSNEIVFKDVTVLNNTFPTTLLTTTSTIDNSAAFVLSLVSNVIISGRNETQGSVFSHNSPGAVLVAGGKLFLNGNLEFSDNVAFRGGALALFDFTILHVIEGSRIMFKRNHALQTGGAIFANSLGTGKENDVCAFQIIGESTISSASEVGLLGLNLTFEANSADVAGNSIYANPLYQCSYLPEASTVQNRFDYREQDIYQAIFNFESSVQNGNQEITSVPHRIAFCSSIDYTSDAVLLKTNVTTIPGKKFSLLLISFDAILTPVRAVMYAELDLHGMLELGPAQSTRRLPGQNCTLIDFNVYGPENTQGNMFLYARLGGLGLTVEVTIEECPPGFHLGIADGQEQCLCDIYVSDVLKTTCNMSTFTIVRPRLSWIGTEDYRNYNVSSVVWVSICPPNHCNPVVVEVDLNVNDQICESGHSGTLCGGCKEGLSVVFGSALCKECTSYWLFSTLVYAVVGLGLVVVIFLLNLTVSKGILNGLIFYVNIVSVNGTIVFSNVAFVKIFISLFNLELGFPVCFYDGMDEASKIGLQFVFPLYLLLLCLVLILLSKWSSRVQKLTSCNSVAVLATLVYISYGKVLRTVIDILSFATVNSEFESNVIWLYDGNLPYFSGSHIALGLGAIAVTLIFIIPYTLPLLFIKLVDRHSILLKPFYDAYAGPYKDKYRYWFGLRLLILIVMCLTYAIAGTDFQPLALSLETFFLVCYTVWQAYCKPYKNRVVGILDLFFLLNFLTIAIWLLHLVNDDGASYGTVKRDSVVVLLVFIAILVTLGIHVYHLYISLCEASTKFKKGMDKCFASVRSFFTYQKLKQMKYKITKPDIKPTDESLGTEQTSNVIPLQVSQTIVSLDTSNEPDHHLRKETFSSLREPMLDYAN